MSLKLVNRFTEKLGQKNGKTKAQTVKVSNMARKKNNHQTHDRCHQTDNAHPPFG